MVGGEAFKAVRGCEAVPWTTVGVGEAAHDGSGYRIYRRDAEGAEKSKHDGERRLVGSNLGCDCFLVLYLFVCHAD